MQQRNEEVILCSEVASDGYKCVPNDQCEDLLGKRTQAFDYYDAVSSPICEDSSKTCCPQSNIKKPNLWRLVDWLMTARKLCDH